MRILKWFDSSCYGNFLWFIFVLGMNCLHMLLFYWTNVDEDNCNLANQLLSYYISRVLPLLNFSLIFMNRLPIDHAFTVAARLTPTTMMLYPLSILK